MHAPRQLLISLCLFLALVLTFNLYGCGKAGTTSGGNGSGSSSVPAAPTGLTAVAAYSQVALTWSASSNAIGYTVKRGTAHGGPYTQVVTLPAMSYIDTSVTNGTEYYYIVTAYNSAGESSASTEASATPSAPHSPMTFYVSPSGSDSATGTLDKPFATVQYAVNQLYPGDVLDVRAGSYHESVTAPRSGTSSAPINIRAYSGECPVLVGATPVTGTWTLVSGAIYKISWATQPTQVYSDSHLLNEARWPNTAIEDFAGQTYALADSGSYDSITYTGSDLPQIDLTGAWIRIMAGQSWVGYDRQITTYDATTGKISFSPSINPTSDSSSISELVPRRNNHFVLYGKLGLLDAPGEWYWDSSAQQLYVWTQDSSAPGSRIEAGTASAVLSLSGQSNIAVTGLLARGGWVNLQGCTSCTLQDFHLWAPTWTRTVSGYGVQPEYLGGVDVTGSGNLVQNGSIRQAGRSSVRVAGDSNTIQQLTIEDSGWNWAAEGAIQMDHANLATVENNTLHRTAMTSIYLSPNSTVENNLIDTSCLFVEDCGNLNAWEMDGKDTEIAYNQIQVNHARWGAGIYLDAGSKNFYLHDNLIQNVQWSGMNITEVNKIESDTILNTQHASVNFEPGSNVVGADWSSGIVKHNQLYEAYALNVSLVQPTSLIPDYGYYNAYTTLAPQPGPRRVEIDWPDLVQPGWSQQQVAMNLSNVNALTFALDVLAAPFNYTVSNLRLLPVGQTNDAGAVSLNSATWTAQCSNGSTCTLTEPSNGVWGITGTNVFQGINALTAKLPSGLTDLTPYRGLAFELEGTASRSYNFQGYQEADNGPDVESGRGATLPASIGADATGAWPSCSSMPEPWLSKSQQ